MIRRNWKAALAAALLSLPLVPANASGDLFYFEAGQGDVVFTLMLIGREDPARSRSAGKACRFRRLPTCSAAITSNSTAPAARPMCVRSAATDCHGLKWTYLESAATC